MSIFLGKMAGGEVKGRPVAKGFSLIELMVALAIGLLILLAVAQAFVIGKRAFDQVDGLATRQDGVRYFSDVFSMHVRTSTFIKEISDDFSCMALDFSSALFQGDFCPDDDRFVVHYVFDSESLLLVESCPSDFAEMDEYLEYSCDDVVQDIAAGGGDFVDDFSILRGLSGSFSPMLFDDEEPQVSFNLMGVRTEVVYPEVSGVSELSFGFNSLNRRNVIYHAVVKAKESNL